LGTAFIRVENGSSRPGHWAFRHDPEAVAGDKSRLGSTLDNGILLLGRKTWQLFSRIFVFADPRVFQAFDLPGQISLGEFPRPR
jgi:hypothetical protein